MNLKKNYIIIIGNSRLIASFIYGGFTLAACVMALIKETGPVWSCVIMAAASILLIAVNNKKYNGKMYLVAVPLALIHICALINGFFTGGINISHHVVRLIVSILIFALLFLSSKSRNKAEV